MRRTQNVPFGAQIADTSRRSRLDRSEFVRPPDADALGETKAPLHVRQQRVVPLRKTNLRVGEALRPTLATLDIRFAFGARRLNIVPHSGEGAPVEGSDELRVFWASAGIESGPFMRLRPATGAFRAARS